MEGALFSAQYFESRTVKDLSVFESILKSLILPFFLVVTIA